MHVRLTSTKLYEKVEMMDCDQPQTNPQEPLGDEHDHSRFEVEDTHSNEHPRGVPCQTH